MPGEMGTIGSCTRMDTAAGLSRYPCVGIHAAAMCMHLGTWTQGH